MLSSLLLDVENLDREDVFSLALVSLQLETDLAHPLAAFARLDFIRLLAFGGGFGAGFLVHLLLAAETLLLETFDDVDCATLLHWDFASGIGSLVHVVRFQAVHAADLVAAGTGKGGGMSESCRTSTETNAHRPDSRTNV